MAFPNCLCKLKHFTVYLRDLILERAEWNKEKDNNWPILHDLIAITTMACLKNEGIKFLKKGTFGWVKHDKNACLRNLRTINGNILIVSRLNGFIKFIIIFMVTCYDGEVQLRAQIHTIDDEELEFYEMKAEEKVAASVHFALCGGYYLGIPVYLQYDIPRLLESIYKVINPIRDYVAQNWQFDNFIDYVKYFPLLLSEALFGKNCDQYNEDINEEGHYKSRHTNPDKLMFLSPEMSDAQVNAKMVIYHYRDDENINYKFISSGNTKKKDTKFNSNNMNRKPIEDVNTMDNTESNFSKSILFQGEDDSESMQTVYASKNSSYLVFKMDGTTINQIKYLKDSHIKDCHTPQMVNNCEDDDKDLSESSIKSIFQDAGVQI